MPNPPVTLTLRGTLRGVRRLLPIAVFAIPFGVAYGAAAVEQGLSVTQAVAMSILVFSGTAQFASLEFWPTPIAYGSLALVVLAVNARLVIMSAALAPWVNDLPMCRRLLALWFLSDANFADSQPSFRSGDRDVGLLFGGGLIMWANWVLGTVIGAIAGAAIGDPSAYGLDVVMVCFFAALVAGQLSRSRAIPVAIAAIVSVATLGWVPLGWNIILAAVMGGITNAYLHAR